MDVIRPGLAADAAVIRRIHNQAFGGCVEADLVDRLAERDKVALALVAEQDGRIVGRILFTPFALASREQTCAAVGLAPLAVVPELQRRGIGSLLIQAGLAQRREAGYKWAVVLGHPDCSPRFGFLPTGRYGLGCVHDVPAEAFRLSSSRRERCGTARKRYDTNPNSMRRELPQVR